MHVIHFESYKSSELVEINKAFQFLQVSVLEKESMEGETIVKKSASLQGGQYKFAGKMKPETRKLLDEFYRPYNKQLAEMLNDSRFEWDNSS